MRKNCYLSNESANLNKFWINHMTEFSQYITVFIFDQIKAVVSIRYYKTINQILPTFKFWIEVYIQTRI